MSNLKSFNQTIARVETQAYLESILGEKKGAFVNNLTTLVANDKGLQECVPTTIMYAAMKATSLDLPLDNNLGFAYVLPYRNNKEGIVEATFQMGYKGIVQLAVRSGQFERINVQDVREGEIKSRNRMTGDIAFNWIEDDKERLSKPVIGYVGYFRLKSGYEKYTYWTKEELVKHGLDYSKTFKKGYGVWKDNFDAMAKKTVLKLMLNKGDAPMSVAIAEALKYDQSVITGENGEARFIDNEKPDSTEQAARFMKSAGDNPDENANTQVEDVEPVNE